MKNPTIYGLESKEIFKEYKRLKQLEFKLNDKRKEINLDEEIENLKKLRAKNARKRRNENEQKHRK